MGQTTRDRQLKVLEACDQANAEAQQRNLRTGNAAKEWDAAKARRTLLAGPWVSGQCLTTHKDRKVRYYVNACDADATRICDTPPQTWSGPDYKAIAQLIAAAPELLWQLQMATDNIALLHDCACTVEQGLSVDLCPCALAENWRNNHKAIAKAEGK